MRHGIVTLFTASLLGFGVGAAAAEIDVMVQNQYLGSDLTPVITAPPDQVNARVVATLENIAASLPAERLARLAKLVRERTPHVLALNEAFEYSCQNLFPASTPATEGCGNQRIKGAFVDFLGTTQAELGGAYVTTARVQNFSVPALPFQIDSYWAVLTVRDRDVILVRSDVAGTAAATPLALSGCRASLEGCNYFPTPFTIQTALGPIAIERGFVAVDLEVAGQPYRVFATHLEVGQLVPGPAGEPTRVLQRLQAAQLVGTALAFPREAERTVLILGDINSDPRDDPTPLPSPIGPLPTPYALIAGSGFSDVWTLRPGSLQGAGRVTGMTCCQDEDLANHKSALSERIDMIFSLAPPAQVRQARVLGDSVSEKTWPPGLGLWPSDHGSVAAKLRY